MYCVLVVYNIKCNILYWILGWYNIKYNILDCELVAIVNNSNICEMHNFLHIMRHIREKHEGEEISVEMKVMARDKAFTHFYFKLF